MVRNDLLLPRNELCWSQVFRDAGYATQYIGKWHLDGAARPGFVEPGWRRRGFSSFEGYNKGHEYHKPHGFDDLGTKLSVVMRKRRAGISAPYYEPTAQTDTAIRFMADNATQPFACFLSWGPPHQPYDPPEIFDRYKPSDIRLRSNVPDAQRKTAKKRLARYYGLCESLDHEMGRLTTFLETSNLSENTLVIFTSDHGDMLGSHGHYGKGNPYEESLHVPLLMRLPGRILAGTRPATMINSVDLMPTLLSLCGLEIPDSCAGCDLSGAIVEDGIPPTVNSVYCEGRVGTKYDPRKSFAAPPGPWRCVVTDRYKLSVRWDYSAVHRLFDLHDDPFEERNLAGEVEARATRSELLGELVAWGRATGDSFPVTPAIAPAESSDVDEQ